MQNISFGFATAQLFLMGKKITYIFPTRSRIEKCYNALVNISKMSVSDNYEIILVLDNDDEVMNDEGVSDELWRYKNVKVSYGQSTGKVNAINRDLKLISDATSIVCLHSDDFFITKFGFDNDIRDAFSDGHNGLVHFPDQVQGDKLCTYAILSKEWVDFFGYIYNPNYDSLYCDRELQDVAKKIGKYKFVPKKIFEHRHYIFGYDQKGELVKPGELAIPDELAKKTDSPEMYAKDKITYLNFKNLAIVTSLSPSHSNAVYQKDAIKSWMNIGEVYSLNTESEIIQLHIEYPDVTFIETKKTIQHIVGRPLVTINAIIDFAIEKGSDLLLINSDIQLYNFPDNLMDDGITIFSRWDYTNNPFEPECKMFTYGFDVVFVPNKFLDSFPPCIYSLGSPWWDVWVGFIAVKNNINIYYPESKHAFHKLHITQYNMQEWEQIGDIFRLEFKYDKQLLCGQIATYVMMEIKSKLIPI